MLSTGRVRLDSVSVSDSNFLSFQSSSGLSCLLFLRGLGGFVVVVLGRVPPYREHDGPTLTVLFGFIDQASWRESGVRG